MFVVYTVMVVVHMIYTMMKSYWYSGFHITVNREIFVYENICVLNVHVNKFSWVPHENILT